ncbi:MAG: hypothetical protein DHS20C21_08080 [Gemmatimonadota bacterium]|nr:MAG: hypothetical protein DHS20C21_08080 [Gemmatimonadota bacterium]
MSTDILSSGSADALPEFSPTPRAGESVLTLDRLSSLALPVTVPLGVVDFDLRSFLELKVGSVLRTNRQTGESLEISVNGTPIARGEVRIQGERFAVRITEILRALPQRDVEGAQINASDVPPPS